MPDSHTTTVPFIPARLQRLRDLADNLAFSWNDQTLGLFAALDERLWHIVNHNPVRLLMEIDPGRLMQAAEDESVLSLYDAAVSRFDDEMGMEKTWFSQQYAHRKGHLIAYFSMEFGLHESLPVYSGGLGILAGDHLKTASSMGIPMIGVGLLYRVSYFKQFIASDGRQQAVYEGAEFSGLPLKLVTDEVRRPVVVRIPVQDREISVRVWKAEVGRVPLLLLDTDFPANRASDRIITERLYDADRTYRLLQELVLGVGGVRMLEALDLPVSIYHLNEGHSALLSIERMQQLTAAGRKWEEALSAVRESTVFTTHTPVPAGNEVFERERMERVLSARHRGILDHNGGSGWRLGQCADEEETGTFNLTILALRTSRKSNAVSVLHGDVSRRMWQRVWPDLPLENVPMDAVTNGVHAPTWIHPSFKGVFRRYLEESWHQHLDDPEFWSRMDAVPDETIWSVHREIKKSMLREVRRRVAALRDRNGEDAAAVCGAAGILGDDVLTIGFARRFAPYKRATLLLHDPERLKRLLGNEDRPVQFIFAGKAHPADSDGKQILRYLYEFSRDAGIADRLVFVENYDMALSRLLIAGCDCWLNTPRRPYEASGTSGMKAAMNGCLNISIKDGWWAEASDTAYGWTIGDDTQDPDHGRQDERDSGALYALLESEVIPAYYQRNGSPWSSRWVDMMKRSISALTPRFSTVRMLREYVGTCYFPNR
ncbi:alpha-glucan family phosphorylase [bacterium]|nr:alpha-glucan family phosphorylase [bacterium]